MLSGNNNTTNGVILIMEYSNDGSSWANEISIHTQTNKARVLPSYPYCRLVLKFAANTPSGTYTFKPMICTEAEYKASQTYQPYAMSNVELTSNISKFTYESLTLDLSQVNFTASMSGTGIYYSDEIQLSSVNIVLGTVVTALTSLLPTDNLFLEQGGAGKVYLFSSTDTFRPASSITFRVFGLTSDIT